MKKLKKGTYFIGDLYFLSLFNFSEEIFSVDISKSSFFQKIKDQYYYKYSTVSNLFGCFRIDCFLSSDIKKILEDNGRVVQFNNDFFVSTNENLIQISSYLFFLDHQAITEEELDNFDSI